MRDTTLLPAALQRPALTPIPRLLLSRDEAAVAIGLSVRELDDLTSPRGPVRCVRVGRRVLFSPAVIQQWIDAETQEGHLTDVGAGIASIASIKNQARNSATLSS